MVEEDTNLFVKFEDPISFRKAILEASKEILISLQDYENFKAIKQQKAELIAKLKEQIAEINVLLNELRKNLPKTGAIKAKVKATFKPAAKPVVIKTVAKAESNELKNIEQQLADIEAQLSNLG